MEQIINIILLLITYFNFLYVDIKNNEVKNVLYSSVYDDKEEGLVLENYLLKLENGKNIIKKIEIYINKRSNEEKIEILKIIDKNMKFFEENNNFSLIIRYLKYRIFLDKDLNLNKNQEFYFNYGKLEYSTLLFLDKKYNIKSKEIKKFINEIKGLYSEIEFKTKEEAFESMVLREPELAKIIDNNNVLPASINFSIKIWNIEKFKIILDKYNYLFEEKLK